MAQLTASKATSPGADPGIFDWGIQTLVQKGLSVNTGRRWRGKYFASRGEQIIGGYQNTIKFLNIPGI